MIHSETLSTQCLEMVKSTKTIEAVKCEGSKNRNKGQQKNRSRSNSLHQCPPGSCSNCGYQHLPESAKLTRSLQEGVLQVWQRRTFCTSLSF